MPTEPFNQPCCTQKKSTNAADEQTWPEPTVPIMDLFPSGVFPVGEEQEYKDVAGGLNAYRSTAAELKEKERLVCKPK